MKQNDCEEICKWIDRLGSCWDPICEMMEHYTTEGSRAGDKYSYEYFYQHVRDFYEASENFKRNVKEMVKVEIAIEDNGPMCAKEYFFQVFGGNKK